ncbi:Uncharacterised protein [Vibrio cholerae]|nr:Uncharacterised protein [Vibrio cholerae]
MCTATYTERIKRGISARPIASKMLNSPAPRKATKMIANSSEGIDITVSRIWFKVLESSPLVMPASAPMVPPTRVAISVIRTAAPMLNSEPSIRRDKISRPRSSVPRK